MRLTDYLDKGASLGPEAPCLTTAGRTLTYGDVQRLSWRIARALDRSGRPSRRQGRDLVRERPGRVQLRVRHLPGGRGVVPGQPAQRGGGKPRPARLLRLHVPDLPGRLRPAGREDPARPAEAHHPGLPRRRAPERHALRPVDRPRARRTLAGRTARRHGHAGRHRGHHRPPQGRDAHRPQHRDDVRADADELPVPPAPALPGPRAAHPRGRRAVLPGHDARRRDRHHAHAGPDRVPGPGREKQDHPHVPAADADLHAPRPRPASPQTDTVSACSACGTARPRCRPAASRRP